VIARTKELLLLSMLASLTASAAIERRLYVAEDQGAIYVYDVGDNHRLIRKFGVPGTGAYKGICADPKRGKIYLSSNVGYQLVCLDLSTEAVAWSLPVKDYSDSPAITPDGRLIYLPRRYGKGWDVIDADLAKVVAFVPVPYGNPHNTWCSRDGSRMYLAALGNENLYVADVATHRIIKTVGPFHPNPDDPWGWTGQTHNGPKGIRPFAVTADDKYCFVNLDGVLGYEIGDIQSGTRLGRVEIEGFKMIRGSHLTTSHGINITPDQTQVWVSDDAGPYVHVFDITAHPHRQVADIKLTGKNGWVTFGIDGRYCYASSGDVIDVKTRRIVAKVVPSEKLLEIQFDNGRPVRAGTR